MRTKRPLGWIYDGDCIRCTSHRPDSRGYPRIGLDFKIARLIISRRLGGKQPSSVVTRHTCDNRWCISPAHITHGSQNDNVADRVARGRNADQRGGRNPGSKLTDEQVATIRVLRGQCSQRLIAERCGISQTQVGRIQRGENRT